MWGILQDKRRNWIIYPVGFPTFYLYYCIHVISLNNYALVLYCFSKAVQENTTKPQRPTKIRVYICPWGSPHGDCWSRLNLLAGLRTRWLLTGLGRPWPGRPVWHKSLLWVSHLPLGWHSHVLLTVMAEEQRNHVGLKTRGQEGWPYKRKLLGGGWVLGAMGK